MKTLSSRVETVGKGEVEGGSIGCEDSNSNIRTRMELCIWLVYRTNETILEIVETGCEFKEAIYTTGPGYDHISPKATVASVVGEISLPPSVASKSNRTRNHM